MEVDGSSNTVDEGWKIRTFKWTPWTFLMFYIINSCLLSAMALGPDF